VRAGYCDEDDWCYYTPSTLGTEICLRATHRCGTCPEGERFVNKIGRLLKPKWAQSGLGVPRARIV